MKSLRLNLGCGAVTPKNWVNVDYALGAWLFKIPGFQVVNRHFKFFNLEWDSNVLLKDLRKRFPWKDNSVDIIYCSHVLEHLSKVEGLCFLRQCYRVLKPEGVARILVPDLNAIVSDYIDGKIAAENFMGSLFAWQGGGIIKRIISTHNTHKCMYDNKSLLRITTDIGFICSTQKPFESTAIPDVYDIEIASGRASTSAIVEAVKPPIREDK